MSESSTKRPTRRGFLEAAAALTGVMPLLPRLAHAAGLPGAAASRTPSVGSASSYLAFNPGEAAFTETMVNALCPADHLTPDGVTSGLATFLDRALADDVDRARAFRAGIAAADLTAQERFGARFSELAPSDAGAFLSEMAAGQVIGTTWLQQVVYPVLMQASLAGPIHDRYSNRVFWKLFGSFGEPTAYRQHMAGRRFMPHVPNGDVDTGRDLQLGQVMRDEWLANGAA